MYKHVYYFMSTGMETRQIVVIYSNLEDYKDALGEIGIMLTGDSKFYKANYIWLSTEFVKGFDVFA